MSQYGKGKKRGRKEQNEISRKMEEKEEREEGKCMMSARLQPLLALRTHTYSYSRARVRKREGEILLC